METPAKDSRDHPASRQRPVRVVYFDHTAELGGAEIALADLVRHLDRTRVEPIVLLGSDGPLRARLADRVPVHLLPIDPDILRAGRQSLGPRSFSSPLRVLRYLLRLRSCLAALQPDILHTNSLKAAIFGGLAGRSIRLQVIWHIRDRISSDYLPAKTAALVRFLARLIPNFVVANSKATLSTLHLQGTPSAVVASGVDLSRFSSQTGADEPSAIHTPRAKVVGIIGRICPWKGQLVFVEAAARVRQLYPDTRFQIIGAAMFNDQPYEEQLLNTIQQRGLTHHIELTGFQEDVGRAIRALDIVVHASTIGEPFGQTIAQGMACRKPVIASNGGGVPELVIHEQTGLLVTMGDSDSLAEAICRLLANENLARHVAESGYRRVLENFTIEATAEKLTRIYESLTRKSQAPRRPSPAA